MKKILGFLVFFALWIACDSYWNQVLLRTPFWGRYSYLVEWTHFGLYGILGIWVVAKKSFDLFIIFFIWCFLDEGLQGFLPDRVPDWLDILRNVIGLLSGFLVAYVVRQVRHGDSPS